MDLEINYEQLMLCLNSLLDLKKYKPDSYTIYRYVEGFWHNHL